MPTPTDGTPMADTWRLEAELFCGTETFRNHMDVKYMGGGTPVPPLAGAAVVVNFTNWIISNYFPDVTLNAVFLRHIYRYTTPPPHVEHPPIFENSESAPGTANTLYGGAHFAGFLPQQACIFVKKASPGGRNGKMFMRNILTEADVQSTIGGVWAFMPHAGGFDPVIFNTNSETVLGPNLIGGADIANYAFAVTHLEHVAIDDPRAIYSTPIQFVTAVRPTWNDTSR